MKKRMIRCFCLLTAALTVLGIVGCGNDAPAAEITTAVSPVTQTAAETQVQTEDEYADDLPADVNLNGETVRFLYRKEIGNEFWSEGVDGSVVNDALYQSLANVQERLNVKLETDLVDGNTTTARVTFRDMVSNQIQSGDCVYDWVDMMMQYMGQMMAKGIFTDLKQSEILDFDKPYYAKGLLENVSLANRLYCTVGDASLGYIKCAVCLYYNKQVADSFKVEDMPALVKGGKWTMDKMMEIAASACADLDNNGKYGLSDTLGFVVSDCNQLYACVQSLGITCYENNGDGTYTYVLGSEHNLDAVDKLQKAVFDNPGSYSIHKSKLSDPTEFNLVCSAFAEDKVLLMTAEMDDGVQLHANTEAGYGILPLPKFNEDSDGYHSCARQTHYSFCMPVTCGADKDRKERAEIVLEALGASNLKDVYPAYFEITMKTKYASDVNDADMYDIIHDGLSLDFGYVYSNTTKVLDPFLTALNIGGKALNRSAMTIVKAYQKKQETVLSDFVAEIEALGQ